VNSVREVARQRCALRDELDNFAKARQHQVETWQDFHIPSLLDAAFATIGAAATTTNRALAAVGRGPFAWAHS
jgi:phage FluMu gp28-like protein